MERITIEEMRTFIEDYKVIMAHEEEMVNSDEIIGCEKSEWINEIQNEELKKMVIIYSHNHNDYSIFYYFQKHTKKVLNTISNDDSKEIFNFAKKNIIYYYDSMYEEIKDNENIDISVLFSLAEDNPEIISNVFFRYYYSSEFNGKNRDAKVEYIMQIIKNNPEAIKTIWYSPDVKRKINKDRVKEIIKIVEENLECICIIWTGLSEVLQEQKFEEIINLFKDDFQKLSVIIQNTDDAVLENILLNYASENPDKIVFIWENMSSQKQEELALSVIGTIYYTNPEYIKILCDKLSEEAKKRIIDNAKEVLNKNSLENEDLRDRIIPTIIEEENNSSVIDYVYLDKYDENYDGKKSSKERGISATDFATLTGAGNDSLNGYTTSKGKLATVAVFRSNSYKEYKIINLVGDESRVDRLDRKNWSFCPALHYRLTSQAVSAQIVLHFLTETKDLIDIRELEKYDIREVKDTNGNTIYNTLQICEYAKNRVEDGLNKKLETLYNCGILLEGLVCTGRWYSDNGQKSEYREYIGRHCPEFEYNGEKYVRVIVSDNNLKYFDLRYSDGTKTGKEGTIRWVKVEPISYIIKNWNEMPKRINPKGNGKAKYFDLRAEEGIISNLPCYSDMRSFIPWGYTRIRGFLNGINIKKDSASEYFSGECNFFNEAFNLSRKPMVEYIIPDTETEIPDDAFNGCITLKKLVIHQGIKSIGKRAFDGVQFKYAYRNQTGELVFAEKLPENSNEYKNKVEIDKMKKVIDIFDYNILLQSSQLDEIIPFFETLNKNNFSIPNNYMKALLNSGNTKLISENTDFRFFKNEVPEILEMLQHYPDEEKLDFYKFATCLGCFSTTKMLDNKGRETKVLLAQKASSLLANMLKTDGMRLRKIS